MKRTRELEQEWRASMLSNPPTDVGVVEEAECEKKSEKGLISSKIFVIEWFLILPWE